MVFGGTLDLYTAAHEAAHVVQQRAGITAPGVGEIIFALGPIKKLNEAKVKAQGMMQILKAKKRAAARRSAPGMAPKLGFGKVATDAKDLATPVGTTQGPVDNRSAALNAARDVGWAWDVHQHGGMDGHHMSVDDLVALGLEAKNDSRFFVRVGLGTGKFDVGQQLKIIHKTVIDANTGTRCTFHVSAGDPTGSPGSSGVSPAHGAANSGTRTRADLRSVAQHADPRTHGR